MDNLKRFVGRNPLTTNDHLKDGRTNHYGQFDRSNRNIGKGDRVLLTKRHNQDNSVKTKCVYCNLENHRSSKCMKVITIADRKEMIKNKSCATTAVSLDIKPVNVLPEAAGNVVPSTIPLSGTSSIQRSLRKIS